MKRQMLIISAAVFAAVALNAEQDRILPGVTACEKQEYQDLQALQQQFEKNVGEEGEEQKGVYTTSHPGAFQKPSFISYDGAFIELIDGSQWEVAWHDQYKVQTWFGEDLFIMLNHNLFSSYDYRIVNLSTGDSAEVNITAGPFFQGALSHWIIAINYAAGQVTLEDGSVWKIPASCLGIMRYWNVNDPVMIGVYDGWFSGYHPNFLINVSLNKINQPAYIYAKCLLY
jgi:hypothetical protein